ncbi:type VII secretion integral membrane protein EccD, partial [Mycobacterium kansasii]
YWPAAMAVVAVCILIASFVAKRFYQRAELSECLLIAAYPVLAAAAAIAVPLPRGTTSLGAPQLAAAATAVLFLTLAIRGGP